MGVGSSTTSSPLTNDPGCLITILPCYLPSAVADINNQSARARVPVHCSAVSRPDTIFNSDISFWMVGPISVSTACKETA